MIARSIQYFLKLLPAPIALLGAILGTTILALHPHIAQAGSPPSWDSLLNAAPQISFAVMLSGPDFYQRNEDIEIPPASTSKLFTASAALEYLGPEFRFETLLRWHRSNPADATEISDLTLVGSGDPTWGMSDFGESQTQSRLDTLARELHNQGVRTVVGALHLEALDPRWDLAIYPTGYSDEDKRTCFGARAQAFNFKLNCSGTAAVQNIRPQIQYLFLAALRRAGINVKTNQRTSNGVATQHSYDALPSDWQDIRSYSPPLSEMLRPMLKQSINLFADALFKAMGARFSPDTPDLIQAGQQALRSLVNDARIDLKDGSGISRDSHTTARALQDHLISISHRPTFASLWNGLPIAGRDGTLATRMRGTAADGVLRAKTGTLSGYYHLAGYVPTIGSSGEMEYHPFVILSQSPIALESRAHEIQDRLGSAFSAYIRAQNQRLISLP